jgi:ATP-dependent Zn protease
VLGLPSPVERYQLLERAAEGLPVQGEIDLELIVERTAGWTGAELVTAVEEACTRSLLDRSDALRQDLLLQVVGERYLVVDERPVPPRFQASVAIHEAGHAVFAELTWPGQVAVVRLDGANGETRLAEEISAQPHDGAELRLLAQLGLAGAAAEQLIEGRDAMTPGSGRDRAASTARLLEALELARPYDLGSLEAGVASDRGSDRMRAALHAELEVAAHAAQADALALLAPHTDAIRRLAAELLAAPDTTLSGDELQAALARALGRVED